MPICWVRRPRERERSNHGQYPIELARPWIWPPIEYGSSQRLGLFGPRMTKWSVRSVQVSDSHSWRGGHSKAQVIAATVQGCAICGMQYAQIYDIC